MKKEIARGVTIRRIHTQYAETGILEGELRKKVPTRIIRPRTNKMKGRAKKHNTATRMGRTGRHKTGVPRRQKPKSTLRLRQIVSLL